MAFAPPLTNANSVTSNLTGQMPKMEHRRVYERPSVWRPFTIYYVGEVEPIEHFYTDANGTPYRVGDGAFTLWQAVPGNETKTLQDFLAAILGGSAVTAATDLISTDAEQHIVLGTDGKLLVTSTSSNIDGGSA